jgi:hypothetical protein
MELEESTVRLAEQRPRATQPLELTKEAPRLAVAGAAEPRDLVRVGDRNG